MLNLACVQREWGLQSQSALSTAQFNNCPTYYEDFEYIV